MDIEVNGPKVSFSIPIPFLNFTLEITETVVIGWLIILAVLGVLLFMTHDLKKVPTKRRQILAEWAVTYVNKMVKDNMGAENLYYAPFIATIFVYSVIGSLVSLLGLRSMTADFNTPLAWAIVTFLLIQGNKIKVNGIKGYLKPFMNPMNLLSEITTPLSMTFRHFGNIAGGMVITALLYAALVTASKAIHLPIPLLTIGIPAVLSVYFDLFSGVMQGYIFIMLMMIFIGMAKEKE